MFCLYKLGNTDAERKIPPVNNLIASGILVHTLLAEGPTAFKHDTYFFNFQSSFVSVKLSREVINDG